MKIVMAPITLDPEPDETFHDELRAAFPQVTIEAANTEDEQKTPHTGRRRVLRLAAARGLPGR